MAIDVIHAFLNIAAPCFTFFCLLFFFPPFQFFKLFLSVLGTLFPEDVSDKVVLITGASSGIGESLAYEYAKRGARLVLAARREKNLEDVAERARLIGSPEVIVEHTDVSKAHDCRKVIDRTMNHFGRLDHLVNNAGVASVAMLEEADDVTKFKGIMDTNFWGCVYMTRYAAPYLRYSKGRIVVLSSSASWLPAPRMSFYNATKAAVMQFFETLRVEFGPDIGITIATPGFIESEMTSGKFIDKEGNVVVDPEMRDVQLNIMPIQSVESCAKSIIRSALRGDRSVTTPSWMKVTYIWRMFMPEAVDWGYRLLYLSVTSEGDTLGKKLIDYTGAKHLMYPESVRASAEAKKE